MELENNEAQSPAVEENAVTAAAKLAAAASAPAPENREVPRWYILHTFRIRAESGADHSRNDA